MKTPSKGLRFLLVALLVIPWLQAVPSLCASQEHTLLPSGFIFDNLPVFSDFDGDNRLDQATLSSNGPHKKILVGLGKSSWSSLSFDSTVSDRGKLLSGDIDQDGDIDLVWISQSAGKFVAWLGDGLGNFTVGTDPKLNLNRIQALLADAAPRLLDPANEQEFPAVLLTTSFIIPACLGYQPHLSPQALLPAGQTPLVCAPCLVAFQQRGPPSSSSDVSLTVQN